MNGAVFGSQGLARLLGAVAPLRALDVGARGRPTPDLRDLGAAVEVHGIEPDAAECARLAEQYARPGSSPYGCVRFYPVALGQTRANRTLYLTVHRGSSTLLKPLSAVGESFARQQYVEVAETRSVDTVALDEFLDSAGIGPIDYMKMDVEGLELEILESAPRLLATTLHVLRVEVAYLATREDQPTAAAIDRLLRDYGFEPLDFLELHRWRRLTRRDSRKQDRRAALPFSRGQLVHGDVLYARSLARLLERPAAERVRAAFALLAYGFVDNAYLLLADPAVHRVCVAPLGIDVAAELRVASRHLARRYRWDRLLRRVGVRRRT